MLTMTKSFSRPSCIRTYTLPPLEMVIYVPVVEEPQISKELNDALDEFMRNQDLKFMPFKPDPVRTLEAVNVTAAELLVSDEAMTEGTAWTTPDAVLRFATAGKAKLTVSRIGRPGDHHSYRITKMNNGGSSFWVAVLKAGYGEYVSIGILETKGFRHLGKWGVESKDPRVQRFAAWHASLLQGRHAPGTHTQHDGVCCVCARELTNPVSIVSGIGPECSRRVGLKPGRSKLSCQPTT